MYNTNALSALEQILKGEIQSLHCTTEGSGEEHDTTIEQEMEFIVEYWEPQHLWHQVAAWSPP